MSREDPQMKLRLPSDLKDRVQEAAAMSKQSVNSLIAAVLEREFPRPTINLHEMAAFLTGLASEAEDDDGDREYVREVNRVLATAKTPWTVKFDMGAVTFYPYASPDGSFDEEATDQTNARQKRIFDAIGKAVDDDRAKGEPL